MASYINPKSAIEVCLAAGVIVSAVAAQFTRIEAIKIVGLTVLTGAGYGILNNMVACRDCIEFFTYGLKYHGQNLDYRPFMTLNPNINAIGWGILATWHVSTLAGLILAHVARSSSSEKKDFSKIDARQLTPYMAAGAVLMGLIAHVRARSAQAAMQQNPIQKYVGVPLNFQAGWEACQVRNSTGYLGMQVGTILLIVAMVTKRLM